MALTSGNGSIDVVLAIAGAVGATFLTFAGTVGGQRLLEKLKGADAGEVAAEQAKAALFKEYSNFINEMRARIASSEARELEAEKRLDRCEALHEECRIQNIELRGKNFDLEADQRRLQARISSLEHRVTSLDNSKDWKD